MKTNNPNNPMIPYRNYKRTAGGILVEHKASFHKETSNLLYNIQTIRKPGGTSKQNIYTT